MMLEMAASRKALRTFWITVSEVEDVKIRHEVMNIKIKIHAIQIDSGRCHHLTPSPKVYVAFLP